MAKPDKTFRLGNVSASIWSREIERDDDSVVTLYSVTPQKSYKQDGETKFGTNFDFTELPLLARVLQRCQVWIEQQEEVEHAQN